MDTLNSSALGQWIVILAQILLAPVVISVLVYFIVRWLKQWLRGAARPKLIATLVFFLVLVLQSLPSAYERYKFNRDVMEEAGGPWARIPFYGCNINPAEPLTLLFRLYAASVVTPESSSSSRFRYAIYQLDEAPQVFLVEPNCDKRTLKDDTGAMREMMQGEIDVFCSDWTKEKEALKAKETGTPLKTRVQSPC